MNRSAPILLFGVVLLGCSPRTTSSSGGWMPGAWHDIGLTPSTAAVLGFAHAQVGKRYCWGGTGPDCFDCSGLVQAAWRTAGIKLPRTAMAQGRALIEVPFDQIRPGDILWWRHHVGLYIGHGEMIDAYHSGAGVVRRPVAIPQRVLRVMPGPSSHLVPYG